jgi:hypothetical protein
MKINKNIFLAMLIFTIMSFNTLAITTDLQLLYSNSSTQSPNIYYDDINKQVIQLEAVTNKYYNYINISNGDFIAQRLYANAVNYGIFTIDQRHYYSYYLSGVLGTFASINSSYSNINDSLDIVIVSDTSGFKGTSKIGNLIYIFRGTSSARLNVYNVSNQTRIFYDNSLPDLSSTDCEITDSDKLSIVGYDEDNDYLYLYCPTSQDFVYMKEDYYLTKQVYNNEELDEDLILSVILPTTYTAQQSNQIPYRFIKENSKIFLKDGVNISNIYVATITDELEGLICNSDDFSSPDNYECWNENSVCWDLEGAYGFYSEDGTGNALCTDNVYYFGLYCNNPQLTLCSGGCTTQKLTNSFGIEYNQATCLQGNCSNECTISGQRISDTLSTYQICGVNYDSDLCLEWSPSIACNLSQLSYNGICESVNTSINYINKLNFNVYPKTESEDVESINYNPTTKTLNVETNEGTMFPLYLNVPYSENIFLGSDCNYQSNTRSETLTTSATIKGYPVFIVGDNTYLYDDFIIPSSTINKEKITIIHNGNALINLRVYALDSTDKIISQVWYKINGLTGEITAYDTDTSGAVLYTFNYNPSKTLGKIEIEMYQDSSKKIQNNIISVYEYIDNNNQPQLINRGVNVVPFTNILAGSTYKLRLKKEGGTTGNIYLNALTEEQISSSVFGFAKLQVSGTDYINNYELTPCIYKTNGCYTARFYLSERLGGQYFSYQDLEVCLNSNAIGEVSEENTILGGLSNTGKIAISLIVSFVVLTFFVIIGLTRNGEIEGRVLVFVGIFFFTASLITFALIKWLPVIILIIPALIGGLGVGFFFLRKGQGD